jgi:dihydrofolate synthase / folylpolyglutamate synthase
MEQILEMLDNPQHKYQVIHITGTNGKGSTAAFIETGLIHAGKSVGKYTSPYIKSINETIVLNHEPISDGNLNFCFYQVQALLDKYKIELSPFEFLTTIMFVYFASRDIEYLVLEVGLGGIDDATNVVNSVISIITNISLEHTKYLGNTLDDIALAKTGIIKNGYTIIADNKRELLAAVKSHTSNYINILDKYQYTTKLDVNEFHTHLKVAGAEAYELSLFGHFQALNFLCAYESLLKLGVGKDSIRYAAENTKHPGRLELRERNPLVIFDATHNLDGARCLVESLSGVYAQYEVVIITSILADKDQVQMLKILSDLAYNIICTELSDNPRSSKAEELAKYAAPFFENITSIPNPLEALQSARQLNKKLIIITGSLYLLSCF